MTLWLRAVMKTKRSESALCPRVRGLRGGGRDVKKKLFWETPHFTNMVYKVIKTLTNKQQKRIHSATIAVCLLKTFCWEAEADQDDSELIKMLYWFLFDPLRPHVKTYMNPCRFQRPTEYILYTLYYNIMIPVRRVHCKIGYICEISMKLSCAPHTWTTS